jgi:hypothetical protein
VRQIVCNHACGTNCLKPNYRGTLLETKLSGQLLLDILRYSLILFDIQSYSIMFLNTL